jgi:hypothetical protein
LSTTASTQYSFNHFGCTPLSQLPRFLFHPFSLVLSLILHELHELHSFQFSSSLDCLRPSWQLGLAASSTLSIAYRGSSNGFFSSSVYLFLFIRAWRPNEITMRQGVSNQHTPWHGCQGIRLHTWPGTPIRSRRGCRNAFRIHGYCLVFSLFFPTLVTFSSRMATEGRVAAPAAYPKPPRPWLMPYGVTNGQYSIYYLNLTSRES